MKRRYDLVNALLGPQPVAFSSLPTAPGKPKLELDLHELGQLHKQFVKAYRSAERANELAERAYGQANEAMYAAYSSLGWLEREIMGLEEKHGLEKTTDFVTLDDDQEGA